MTATLKGGETREEGKDEVCPVTIAEELLAMQIDSLGGGKNLRLGRERERKKNFKETFTPLFSHALLYSDQASGENEKL